jgi:LysM repeat protein
MKTTFFHLSLFLSLAFVTPLHSATEVEQLRALNTQQAKRIQELEQKIAQLTNTPPPIPQVAESRPEPSDISSYTVKDGDNLLRIARNHGTTPAVLNELNGLKPDAIIRVGQKLKVPNNSPAQVSSPAQTAAATPPTIQPAVAVSVQHKVAEKETLSSIARKYEVSTDSLIKANPDINPNVLKIGQTIRIPESSRPPVSVTLVPGPKATLPPTTTPQPAPIDPSKPIKITEKMTFEEFARKHNTTTDRINELNNLRLDPSSNLAKGSEFYVSPP